MGGTTTKNSCSLDFGLVQGLTWALTLTTITVPLPLPVQELFIKDLKYHANFYKCTNNQITLFIVLNLYTTAMSNENLQKLPVVDNVYNCTSHVSPILWEVSKWISLSTPAKYTHTANIAQAYYFVLVTVLASATSYNTIINF